MDLLSGLSEVLPLFQQQMDPLPGQQVSTIRTQLQQQQQQQVQQQFLLRNGSDRRGNIYVSRYLGSLLLPREQQQHEKQSQQPYSWLSRGRRIVQNASANPRQIFSQQLQPQLTNYLNNNNREHNHEICNQPVVQRYTNLQEEREDELSVARKQLKKKDQELADLSKEMNQMTQQLENYQNQLQRKRNECLQLKQLHNEERTLMMEREKLKNLEGILHQQEMDELRRRKASVETQLSQMREQQLQERDRFDAQNRLLREAEKQLAQREESSHDWIIRRDEVQMTEKCLGSGGWGTVYEGRYCGCVVAVKQMHEQLANFLEKFKREVDMASRCRHPCLLQFIGATVDGGFPLLVTELMETTLRRLLCDQCLTIREISIISLDVARALNYLHKKRPVPMIHPDISSANVLLWRQAGRETDIQKGEGRFQWRGKVSDYETAKFVEEVMTQNPGCLAYSAPEARTPTQAEKIDVYSFGILLCEMCINKYPEPDKRATQVAKMSDRVLQGLVRRCLQKNPDDRPDMTEIISELEQFQKEQDQSPDMC